MDNFNKFNKTRNFLLLQGPIGSFFKELSEDLKSKECNVYKINFWGGDILYYPDGITFDKDIKEWEKFISNFCIKNKITDIVLFGDRRPYHEKAIEALSKISNNFNIWVLEEGYFRPHWVTVDQYGSNYRSHINTKLDMEDENYSKLNKENFYHIEPWLKEGILTILNYYFISLITKPFFSKYKHHRLKHPLIELFGWGYKLLASATKIKNDEKKIEEAKEKLQNHFVLALQLETDFQIRKYSPFKNLEEVMEKTIVSFSRNAPKDSNLIVKAHPYDETWFLKEMSFNKLVKKYGIEKRAAFINNCTASTLIKDCKGVITVNSTFALFVLERNIPVKALGKAFWNQEKVCDQKNIDNFWQSPENPDEKSFYDLKHRILKTQINGNFYSKQGKRILLNKISDYLLETRQDTAYLSKIVQERYEKNKERNRSILSLNLKK
jgi:capsular polysaccharide export protein